MAPPPPAAVTEPVDVEPEISTKVEGPDLGDLAEAAALVEPVLEEAPLVAPEAVMPAGEPMLEVPVTPLPEAAAPLVEPPLEIAVTPEFAAEAVAPAVEQLPMEVAPAAEEAPVPAEPVLVEEVAPFAPPPAPEEEGTMVFRSPGGLAEPVLSEELGAAPAVAEGPAAPTAEPEVSEAEPVAAPEAVLPEAEPVAATTLEAFTLTEATAGQVRFAAPEMEVVPEAETAAAAPTPAPEAVAAPAPVAAIDANLIYAIVHRVVLKMAPPALPAEVIEDMARQFADEILAELGGAPPHS
jgi:hypothetical protein